jgi:type II restriction/modification system DNA methylase subunit YeeA
MNIAEFIAKWRKVELKERSAAQEHFLDLCHVFDHPTPAALDPTGVSFCFEKGAEKHGGGDGFADVWKKGFFGWEYKGKHKDLDDAYDQLLQYRNNLENPPLLVLCDLDRIVINTNFTGTVSTAYEIPLESLTEPRNIEIMRAVFHHPETLRPGRTSTAVTQEAAKHFAEMAAALRERGLDPAAVAHFLDRIVFCLFAEDTGLLPDMVFSRIVEKSGGDPARYGKMLGQLFDTMATGGDYGVETIRHFNGNLFDDRSVLALTPDDIKRIAAAATLDWSAVDPSIFGTLFERGLDPAKRSQLGAHFTSKADIELVVDAVVMTPLRREWDQTKAIIQCLLATGRKSGGSGFGVQGKLSDSKLKKAKGEADSLLHQFLTRLRAVKILDPACGSGNFLYVALLRLKDLEQEAAVTFPSENGLNSYLPGVSPSQLYGIEINSYAHDLAQMTVWIGWLQWIRANGFGFPDNPILRPLTDNIRRMDAILAENGEPEWPAVDFIIGNPPFLGDKIMRRELGDEYVDKLRTLYADRLPGQSDLCCYWFEKARAHIAAGKCRRAGLLATQGIRGGANREVLKRIKDSGGIFWAQSDRPWILDGANVHVSMVAFDGGAETTHTLDGKPVPTINANLTGTSDSGDARILAENATLSFIGASMHGPFPLDEDAASGMLLMPNPDGRPNSDVVRPWVNGMSITRRQEGLWIVDYPPSVSLDEAALYADPFQHVKTTVKPLRDENRRAMRARNWWLLGDPQKAMREAVVSLPRYLGTARIAKHKLFMWFGVEILPTDQVVVFARSDDLFFGVMQSRFHEVWALHMGTRLETRPRYTPSTCFDTFPFPANALDSTEALSTEIIAIAQAAKKLNDLRNGWLNPPDWIRVETMEFPGTVGGPWDRYIDPATVADRGAFKVGTVRYPRLVARDAACTAKLKDRTLTKLYNERPAWLADCHARLDAAVAAAYGWPADLSDDSILERLLALNLQVSRRLDITTA